MALSPSPPDVPLSTLQPFIKDHQLWEPVVAVECSVPWDVFSLLDRTVQFAKNFEFLEPFVVPSSKPYFCIHFRVKRSRDIVVHLQQPCMYSFVANLTDIMVKSLVLVTKRDSGNNPEPWQLPEKIQSMLFNSPGFTEDNAQILCMPQSKIQCFTVKVEVYERRASRGELLLMNLNLDRKMCSPLCDVVLQVDGEDFPAHKNVLCATSSVFMAMFTGEFKEKITGTVIIKGVSKEAFSMFLDFLYTDEIVKWEGYELELLDLSERYQVQRLKERAEMCLWVLDSQRALRILMEADRWPVLTKEMKNRLCQLVAVSWPSVADSGDWQTLQSTNQVMSGIIQAFASSVSTVPRSLKFFNQFNSSENSLLSERE